MIEHLPRVVTSVSPARVDEVAGEAHPMRHVTRSVAFELDAWDDERRAKVSDLFDELAEEWHTRATPDRDLPLLDALDRGDVGDGVCLELGSGIGLASSLLADRFEQVIASDLSFEMLRRAPVSPPRMRADGNCLPLPDDSVDVLVLINMFLFPDEVERIVRPNGRVVWINSRGPDTPIHLSAEEVDAALGGQWHGVASEAGVGTWVVLRRQGRPSA